MRPLLAALGIVVTVGTASAEPFTWDAPDSCPTGASVQARVERRLGGSLAGTIDGLEITVTRERGGFVATIDARAITVANAVRTLRAERCDELADGIALIVARLAAEHRGRRASSTSPALDLVMPPMMVGDAPRRRGLEARDLRGPDEVPVLALHRPRPSTAFGDDVAGPWGGSAYVLGTSGVGALPGVNVGAEVGGYVRRADRFAGLALGRWTTPESGMSLDVVTIRGGWNPRGLPLRAWFMGELGQIQGAAVAYGAPPPVTRWTAVGGGFGVAWPMAPRARLVGTVELAIPVARADMPMPGASGPHQPAGAAARCSFGLEVGWR